MTDIALIRMPLWQLPVVVILPLAAWIAVVAWLRRLTRARSARKEEPDWSVPPLETSEDNSPLHLWDVRCKIVTILAYSFLITALRQPVPALIAIALSSLVLVVAKVSFFRVLLRLLAIAGFVTMFLVVMPFTVPVHSGDTVLVFGGLGWLGFSLRGLRLAATIAAKAVAITLLMEPLLSTAPLPVTLQGLARLWVPEMVAQMVLLSYRYLNVFRHEARRMAGGMRVRGFRKRTDMGTLKATANFLGMLFVRSYERTERVFEAMRARGYKGRFPEPAELRLHARDLLLAGVWLSVGVALVCCDRLVY
jgi:cobalt/nickel transport system permease protein